MITDVVAALVWDGDRFLACQRPAHKARGLLWEFVGGKVEPGETLQNALIRECQEELAVTVRVGEVFMTLVHEYPDITVRLTLFNATITSGFLQKLEHNDIRWITTKEIDNFAFCPADVEILEKLKTIDNGIQAELVSLEDSQYKAFQCALMPTVDREKVIGVRMPALRKLSKHLLSVGETTEFLNQLPHRFYDENNLHGLLISEIVDYQRAVEELDRFLPYVDNWATCDLIAVKAFCCRPEGLMEKIGEWLLSGHTYTIRYAISVLMRYYLDEGFSPQHLKMVSEIRTDEYYVNMMIAWYLATGLAKQYDSVIELLYSNALSKWVHNKTIQKALESNRISDEKKQYLKTLKVK